MGSPETTSKAPFAKNDRALCNSAIAETTNQAVAFFEGKTASLGLSMILGAPILAGAAVMFALLAGGNVILFNLHSRALEQKAAAEAKHTQALAVADACNRAVTELQRLGREREEAAKKRIAAAQQEVWKAQGKALAVLQAQPTVAGDACASAAALHKTQIQARRAGKGSG